jgi:hypothetical protein
MQICMTPSLGVWHGHGFGAMGMALASKSMLTSKWCGPQPANGETSSAQLGGRDFYLFTIASDCVGADPE